MRCVIDIETASTVDLGAAGADAYAEDVTTRVLCLAYQIDNRPIEIWAPGEPVPLDASSLMTYVAHNAGFEIAIWKHVLEPLGWPPVPPIEQWSCTMARAQYHGLPAALEDVALALRFPPDQRKDAAGRRVMLQLMRPRSIYPMVRWWHEDVPAKYEALKRYCVRDVEIEAKLDRLLPELPPKEQELWRINHESNTRGVYLDTDLIDRMAEIVRTEIRRLNQELRQVSGNRLFSVTNVERTRKFLIEEHHVKGLDVLDKEIVSHVLATDPTLDPVAERILEIRAEAAKTSTSKLIAMRNSISLDGQARGLFRYYGASRTGRYSSQRVQLQNMARPMIKDVAGAIALIKQVPPCLADGNALNLLFNESAMSVVASCMRGCILPRPGHKLVVADLAQIEARVIAWLAGQNDILDIFASGRDVYTYVANSVGSTERQLGKVMVLALGFGMGALKFVTTAAKWGIHLGEGTARHLVDSWRHANPNIVRFWYDLEDAALRVATQTHGYREQVGRITLERRKQAMVMVLPSGRELFYHHVGRELKTTPWGAKRWQITHTGVNQFSRQWEVLHAWAGRLAENATQAVARDILTEAILWLHRQTAINLVGTVHDELIAESPIDRAEGHLAVMLAVLKTPPAWAKSLPVWAEGSVLDRYGK